MEQKLNITEILKNKALGTKLWSSLFGDVYFDSASANLVTVSHHKALAKFWSNAKLYDYDEAEPTLFPSKEMRDWSKFAWKKGDVLVSMEGSKILFDKWANEDYTKFLGKIKLLGDSHCYDTANYSLASKEEALEFIKSVEEINNGKLNLETLRIEKSEFKDGDILSCDEDTYTKHTTLILHKNGCVVESLVSLIRHNDLVESREPINEVLLSRLYYAREDEKKELFDALAKEGKTWDAEKKQIVDIKKEHQFKPFEKVLVRDSYDDMWRASFFSHIKENDGRYVTTCLTWRFCVPYEGNEYLLGTTNNVKD